MHRPGATRRAIGQLPLLSAVGWKHGHASAVRLAQTSDGGREQTRAAARRRQLAVESALEVLRESTLAPSAGRSWDAVLSDSNDPATAFFDDMFVAILAGTPAILSAGYFLQIATGSFLPADCTVHTDVISAIKDALPTRSWNNSDKREDFCLAGNVCVPVIASDAIKATFRKRHVMVPVASRGYRDDIVGVLKDERVAVLYGASGSGKTEEALLACRELNVLGVLYLTFEHSALARFETVTASPKPNPSDNKDAYTRWTSDRDEAALDIIERAVGTLIKPEFRADVPEGRLVLVIDEIGRYAEFARAIISCSGGPCLAERIYNQTGHKGTINIVIAGTGMEGAAHDIGSQPSKFKAFHIRTPVWPALTDNVSTLRPQAQRVVELVNKATTSPTAALLRRLVQNARCAALLLVEVEKKLYGSLTEATLWPAAVRVVVEYHNRNGLYQLTYPEVVTVILSAMACQLGETVGPPGTTVSLFDLRSKYGLVIDHAVFKDGSLRVPDDRPRYEVEAAFEATLLLACGMGQRPPTGEGFEQAFADFMAVVVTFAGMPVGGVFDQVHLEPLLERCIRDQDSVPFGWAPPLRIVSWLRALGVKAEAPAQMHLSRRRIEPWRGSKLVKAHDGVTVVEQKKNYYAEMREAIARFTKGPDTAIVVNGALAQWADVMVNIPGPAAADVVVLCQTKLYMKTKLSQHELLFELHKMGCREPIVVAGAWACRASADDIKRGYGQFVNGKASHVERDALVGQLAKDLRGMSRSAAHKHVSKLPGLDELPGGAELLDSGLPAPSNRSGTRQIGFVVAVFGDVAELSKDVAALVAASGRILLLQDATSPREDRESDEKHLAYLHRRRLRGFYPVEVATLDNGVQPCAMPKPAYPTEAP